MVDLALPHNPVWQRSDNLRDPAVLPTSDGYLIFYSRFSNGDWREPENWAIAWTFTEDFVSFRCDRDITPKGYASPGDPVHWHGRFLLPYQSHPAGPSRLHYSSYGRGGRWSDPVPFLMQANSLPWNTVHRASDPSFVADGDTLHCFFVGAQGQNGSRGDFLGHAITQDPQLQEWEILSWDNPVAVASDSELTGMQHQCIFRSGDRLWTMIYSEGLPNEHLAYAQSADLMTWERQGRLDLPVQSWMKGRYGAPYVWRDADGRWLMLLMGQDLSGHTSLGLFSSDDALHWEPLPERQAA
jgi:hypothetical protein